MRNNTDIERTSYRFIHVTPRKFFGFNTVTIEGTTINMADKEKTLIDNLEKFKYIGGLAEVIRILAHHIDALDVRRIIDCTILMDPVP